ncbi:MAG: 50S ribosomal protein L18 [Pseudomonadota bacterium]
MGLTNEKLRARLKRKKRIRKKMLGTNERPRLSVFRSARHMYAQIIEDTTGQTLVSASTTEKVVREMPKFEDKKAAAHHIGKLLARRAAEKEISRVVFDRNGFLYHGRIKALSTGAREGGLDF